MKPSLLKFFISFFTPFAFFGVLQTFQTAILGPANHLLAISFFSVFLTYCTIHKSYFEGLASSYILAYMLSIFSVANFSICLALTILIFHLIILFKELFYWNEITFDITTLLLLCIFSGPLLALLSVLYGSPWGRVFLIPNAFKSLTLITTPMAYFFVIKALSYFKRFSMEGETK